MDLCNFDCPQYVNFREEFNCNDDSVTDAEVSTCSVIDDVQSEGLDVEDENAGSYNYQYQVSYSESNQSALSESYLPHNSSQDSVAESYCLAEKFPVHCPKNLSMLEKGKKKHVKVKTEKKPTHLNESRKRKMEDQYVPLAEQVVAFHKKTPDRFHSTGSKAFEPVKQWFPQMIIPKSPTLLAAKRIRAVNVLSREEQEAKEVEEIKRYKFRAQPVKHNRSNNSLPKVGKKKPTRPKSFYLRTAQRAAEIHPRKKEEKPFEFRANPLPKSILSGPTGLKEKLPLPVTQPKTPNFALKSRAEKWRSENKLNDCTQNKFKALPAPAATSPFAIKHEKKCTEIHPFSFDVKDRERMAKKEQKIHEEIEKENRLFQFKAQPIPSPTPSVLPAVPKKPLTDPQPFALSVKGKDFKNSSLNLSNTVCPTFKAHPATVLEKPPFVPEKLQKLPLDVKEFQLRTVVRAAERQKLKEIQDIEEREKEKELQQLKELQEEEERREIQKLRKEIVHKANPIRHYKPVEVKPSNRPLTLPVAPKFHTDERLQTRYLE